MAKPRLKIIHPADTTDSAKRCAPGSIEQQLDMCEGGNLRGEDIQQTHGMNERLNDSRPNQPLDPVKMERNYRIDMSEENREGDEETGDEHSAGLQGGEQQELQYDDHYGEADSGLPGEQTEKNAHNDPTLRGHRRRMG